MRIFRRNNHLFADPLRWLILFGFIIMVSGCRYWSVYRFADQFCHFDQHIALEHYQGLTHIQFANPVLPLPVFERYFKASAISRLKDEQGEVLTYKLALQSTVEPREYEVRASFSGDKEHLLLASGNLDAQLSTTFTPAFIYDVLSSACGEELTFSSQHVTLNFSLPATVRDRRPSQKDIYTLFGKGLRHQATTSPKESYLFDFVSSDAQGTQQKTIYLTVNYAPDGALDHLSVRYLNYALDLDLDALSGTLHVDRS